MFFPFCLSNIHVDILPLMVHVDTALFISHVQYGNMETRDVIFRGKQIQTEAHVSHMSAHFLYNKSDGRQ